MRDPQPRKWITWEIPKEYLENTPGKQIEILDEYLKEEVSKALEDMVNDIPVTFKITNLPKEF